MGRVLLGLAFQQGLGTDINARSVPILLSYHGEDECDKLCYFEHDNHPFLRSIKAADNAEVNAVGGEIILTCSQRSAGRALHQPEYADDDRHGDGFLRTHGDHDQEHLGAGLFAALADEIQGRTMQQQR